MVATYTLSGTLNAGEVYVIGNVASGSGIRNVRDVADFSVTNFYGNYAIALLHNGVIVDFIGDNNGVDPGTGWDVAGTAEATANHTLVRKPSVTEGNPTPRKSFGTNAHNSEWIVYPENEFSYLGSHCILPSTQATNVAFGDTDHTSMVVTWTKGARYSLVVVKAGSAVDAMPIWNADYTSATADFSVGEVPLGTNNVVVYSNDSEETVTVTGLAPGTTYHVAVYAYSAIGFCYNTTSPARGSTSTDAIAVTATELAITAPANATVSTAFEVVVTAVDGSGNAALNATPEVTLSHSGSGTLTSTAGLVARLASGVYTWSDLQYDEEEAITLTVTDNAGSSPLTAVTSGNIEVTAVATITTVFFSEYIEWKYV